MPSTDSLTIRHTPGTVPGGARPGWGLPFQQLPTATRRDLTPESMLQQEMQTGRQGIQDKYALQWKEAQRSARFVGRQKTANMLRQIDMRAKQEMLQFNQQAQAQLTQLQDINRLAQQGLISPEDAARINAGRAYGSDVAARMYPRPEKEPSVPEQFGRMDVLSQRISDELDLFKVVKEEVKSPSWLYGLTGPIVYGTVAARRLAKAKKAKSELQILDYSLPSGSTDEYGDPEMGKYRKVTEGEKQFYDFYKKIEKDIKAEKTRIAGQLDVGRRIVQPGTTGGTFSDKVTESYKKQPTAAELHKQGTREAYEEGKRLRYWD